MTTRVLAIAISVLVFMTAFAGPKDKVKAKSRSKTSVSRSHKSSKGSAKSSRSTKKSSKSSKKSSKTRSASHSSSKKSSKSEVSRVRRTGVSAQNGPAPLGRGTMTGTNVVVRSQPSSDSGVVTKVTGGNVAVIAKSGDWYKVRFQHGSIGWVRSDYLVTPTNTTAQRIAGSDPKTVTISNVNEPKTEVSVPGAQYTYIRAMNTNVRRGPSETNSVAVKVSGGKAEILDKWGNWYKLKFQYGTVGWVRADLTTNNPKEKIEGTNTYVASIPSSEKVENVLASANKMRGTRYNYGSASRSATDCSGFTLQVFRSNGISLPRTAREQVHKGVPVSRGNLQAGDLVFFNTRGYVSHVGIYTGNNKFIHASSGAGRVIESSLSGYYSARYITARRVIKGGTKKIELPKVDVVEKERPVDAPAPGDDGEYKIDLASGGAASGGN